MSLLKRMADLIRSNVNDALDKAEDPKKILEQTLLDMEGEHKKAKKMLLETLTLLKQSERQAEAYAKQSGEWESKAMAALKAGNEDLARQALQEKTRIDELRAEAEHGTAQQKAYTDELKKSLVQLEQKVGEAKKKRDELVARLSAAELKKKQADMRNGNMPGKDYVNDGSAFDTFDRMASRIENDEAEVEARRELMGDAGTEVDLELNKQLEAQNADAALEALKAKMVGTGVAAVPPPAEPAPDDPQAKAIEDELAALRKKLDGGD